MSMRRVLAATCVLALTTGAVRPAAASTQEQPTTSTTAPADVVTAPTDVAPTTTAPPTTAAAATGSNTLSALGYSALALRGTYGSAEVFVPVPADRAATAATIELRYQLSPLLVSRSTLTVLVGGVPLASSRLDQAGGTSGVLTATVPAELIGSDGLTVQIQGFLRLTDDDCEESDNPGQWVTLDPSSTVTLTTVSAKPSLSRLPSLLGGGVREPGTDGGPTIPARVDIDVVDPSAPGLAAAAATAWQVGRWHAQRTADPMITVGDDLAPVRLTVGPVASLGPTQQSALDGEVSSAVVAVTSTDPVEVIVSGAGRGDVLRSARALSRPSLVASWSGATAGIGELLASSRPEAPWRAESTTFAQLGVGSRDVVGLGSREVTFAIDRPPGWTIADDITVRLVLDASAALQESSTVGLSVNGFDVGSRRLASRSGSSSPSFTIPAGIVDRTIDGRPVRTLDLTLSFVLDLPEQRCQAPDPAAARVTILPTSSISVPHRSTGGHELGRFPHPLGTDGEPVVIVVSDTDDRSLAAGLQLAAAIGRSDPSGSVAPHLVSLGQFREDPALSSLDVVLLGDQAAALVAIPDRPKPEAGQDAVIALSTDPADGERTVLSITGRGLLEAAQLLSTRAALAALDGRVAAVVERSATAITDDGQVRGPLVLVPVDEDDLEVESWTLPAVVTLAGLLISAGLLVRYRWRRPSGRHTQT